MSPAPPVLAICVNWNGGSLLLETIESLLSSQYAALQVLVVDCASTDGSADSLPERTHLLRLAGNRGYAAALNRGFEWASARSIPHEYVLALNNDIRLESDCLSRLVAAGEECRPCICGPKVLQWREPDRLEASWGEVSWTHVLARFHDRNRLDSEGEVTPRPVPLLLGSILLLSSDVFHRVGAWDENFFLYHEEIDYLYRASTSGVRILFVPAARAFHWSGWGTRSDSLQKVYWTRRNTLYFFHKHQASPGAWTLYFVSLAASLIWNLITLRWRRMLVICRGVGHGLAMGRNRG